MLLPLTGGLPRQQRLEELTRALSEHKSEKARSEAERKLPLPGTPSRDPADYKSALPPGPASERHNNSASGLQEGSFPQELQQSLSRLRIDTSSKFLPEESCGPPLVQNQYSKRHKRSRSISHDGRPTPQVQTPRADGSSNAAAEGQLRSYRELKGLPTYRRTPPQTPQSIRYTPFNLPAG